MAANGNTPTSDLPSWEPLPEAINPSPPSVDTLYHQGLANIVDYWQRGRITSEQAMGLIEMLVVAKLECDAGKRRLRVCG